MSDYGAAYKETQGRIMALVNAQNASTPVPACPGWMVKDVIAHLFGVLNDLVTGNMEGAGTDETTARHVAEGKNQTFSGILAQWNDLAHSSTELFDNPAAKFINVDLVTHEHDIRGAIGQPGCRTHPSVMSATRAYLGERDRHFRQEELPALRFDLDGEEIVVGKGEPQGTLHSGWFEAFRTVSGRRTPGQVRNLDWDGDPETWIDHLFVLGPAAHDQVE